MAEVFYRGLQYPLEVKNGNLIVVENLDIIEQNIIEVLETRPFERVMRSNYGFDPRIFDVMEPKKIRFALSKFLLS